MRVLVVEDEKKVARALREGLEAEHYDVRVASSGEEGFFLVNNEMFDCVVLDLMLPHRDGLEILATVRKRGLQTPVLILTAKDTINGSGECSTAIPIMRPQEKKASVIPIATSPGGTHAGQSPHSARKMPKPRSNPP